MPIRGERTDTPALARGAEIGLREPAQEPAGDAADLRARRCYRDLLPSTSTRAEPPKLQKTSSTRRKADRPLPAFPFLRGTR